jgi:putative flippase GtrA
MIQLFRFLAVGLLATASHFIVVIALVERWSLDVVSANALAWTVALCVSYKGHHRWTFPGESAHANLFPRYTAVSLTGLALNLATVWLFHHHLSAHYLVATTFGVALSVLVTFMLSRFWVFVGYGPGK